MLSHIALDSIRGMILMWMLFTAFWLCFYGMFTRS